MGLNLFALQPLKRPSGSCSAYPPVLVADADHPPGPRRSGRKGVLGRTPKPANRFGLTKDLAVCSNPTYRDENPWLRRLRKKLPGKRGVAWNKGFKIGKKDALTFCDARFSRMSPQQPWCWLMIGDVGRQLNLKNRASGRIAHDPNPTLVALND